MAVLICAGSAPASPRDVQLRAIDFETGVLEIYNYGAAAQDLTSWQLCTGNDDSVFSNEYTGFEGLNGISLAPGGSLFVHYNDDAPAADPSHVNISDLGFFSGTGAGFAPLMRDAYGIGLYMAPNPFRSFSDPTQMADYMQWSLGGVPDVEAGHRGIVAVNAGLWTSTSDWISVDASTAALQLDAASGGLLLHGPGDFQVMTAAPALRRWGGWVLAAALMLATGGLSAWRRAA